MPSQPRLQLVKAMLPWTEVHGFNMPSRPRLKLRVRAVAAGLRGWGAFAVASATESRVGSVCGRVRD